MNVPTAGLEPQAPAAPPPDSGAPGDERGALWVIGLVGRGITNVVSIVGIIALTYVCIVYASTLRRESKAVAQTDQTALRKLAQLHAQDQELLASYGIKDAATQTVHIPIERAMQVVASEAAQPAAPMEAAAAAEAVAPVAVAPAATGPSAAPAAPAAAPAVASASTPPAAATLPQRAAPVASTTPAPGPSAPAPQPVAVASIATPHPAAPAARIAPVSVARPAPRPMGLSPLQLYQAVCQACHDVDGRGGIVRKAMPTIPDLTDAKWQASRTDADLEHSILEGKGQFMLPRKDVLAMAHTSTKDMIAFMRSFQSGKQFSTGQPVAAAAPVVSAPSTPTSVPAAPTLTSVPAAPVAPAPAAPPVAPPASSAPAAAPIAAAPVAAAAPSTPAPAAAPAPVAERPATPPTTTAASVAPPAAPPAPASPPEPAAADVAALLAKVTQFASGAPASSPSPGALSASTGPRPANTEKLRAASEIFRANCLACHGGDGRGTLMRVAMPPIPDFTTRDWQTSRVSAQLAASILDGKGGLMPAWRGRVTPEQAQDLAAFVRTFGPADLVLDEAAPSEFTNRFHSLAQQWDELEVKAKTLIVP